MSRSYRSLFVAAWVLLGLSAPLPVFAADEAMDVQDLAKRLEPLETLIKQQQKTLEEQDRKLEAQSKELDTYKKKLNALAVSGKEPSQPARAASTKKPKSDAAVKKVSVAARPVQKEIVVASSATTVPPAQPQQPEKVGVPEKKNDKETRPEINVLPDAGGVLTPKGTLMYENSLEYTNTTSNVFSFDGVRVSEVVLVGTFTATSARRQVFQDSSRLRMGLTNRLEADVRVPYVYRTDSITDTTDGSKRSFEGHDIGDVDVGLGYQLNQGRDEWPFFVANLRYKSDTGTGPFDVPYDSTNTATKLATGSGYQSVEASMTAIKVTDPAVLFVNLGYVHGFSVKDKVLNSTLTIKESSPGPVLNASGGLGFSINPETSFTLGYKHSVVLPTHQKVIDTGTLSESRSDTLNVGAFMVGASYRVNPKLSLNFTAEVGATRDAPDVHLGLRIPIEVAKFY